MRARVGGETFMEPWTWQGSLVWSWLVSGRQIMELGGGTTRQGVKDVVSRDGENNGQQEEEGGLEGWPWRLA